MWFEHGSVGHLFTLIAGIHVRSKRIIEGELKPFGLTYPQFGALGILVTGDPMTQVELSRRLQSDTTTTAVICNALQRKGYLRRERSTVDRRANLLVLTDEGRRVAGEAFPVMEAYLERLHAAIGPEALRSVGPVLERLYTDVEGLDPRRPKAQD